MNETLRDVLLIALIVVVCLGSYIIWDTNKDITSRLLDLESGVSYLRSSLECVEETCDGRFECSMDYWTSIKHEWY